MKRISALILVLCLSLLPIVGAYADDAEPPRLTDIATTRAVITVSGLTAKCEAKVTTNSSLSITITMELQKLSGGAYTTVKTWTKTGTGLSLSDSRTRLINTSATYRLRATFVAGADTVVVYAYP